MDNTETLPTVIKAAIDGYRLPVRQADGKRSPVVEVGDLVLVDGAAKKVVKIVELGGLTKLFVEEGNE